MIRKRGFRRILAVAALVAAFAVCGFDYVRYNIHAVWRQATLNDFKHIYLGAHAVKRGFSPYDPQTLALLGMREGIDRLNPYVYPPFTALLLQPLTAFGVGTAGRIWIAANHLFFWASAILLLRTLIRGPLRRSMAAPRTRRTIRVLLLLALAFAASHPMFRTLSAGQLTVLLMVLIAAAAFAESRNRSFAAVSLLAVAAMVKVTPGVLILHYVVRRDWRSVGVFAIAMVVLLLLSVAAAGWEMHGEYLPLLRDMGYGKSTWALFGEAFYSDTWNQAPSALWYRLFTDQRGNNAGTMGFLDAPALARGLSYAAALACLGAAFVLDRRGGRRAGPGGLGFMVWIYPMLLGPSLMWDHYLILAFPPAAAMAVEALRRRAWGIALGTGIALVMMLPMFPLDAPALKQGAGLLLLSYKTWGLLLLFGLHGRLLWMVGGESAEDAEAAEETGETVTEEAGAAHA